MRTLLLLYFFLLSFQVKSQTHICSQHKQSNYSTQFENKTRMSTKAKDLMNQYDVKHYDLDLHIERDTSFIEGKVGIRILTRFNGLDTFAFELNPSLTIDSIVYNQTKLNFTINSTEVYANFISHIPKAKVLDIYIYYHGVATIMNGKGLFSIKNSKFVNGITYTSSEPYSAISWFPCKQFLQDKADSVRVAITTDSTSYVISNGLLTSKHNLLNGKFQYVWESKYPIDYYLIAVAVSDYKKYSELLELDCDPGNFIPLELYYPPGFENDPYFSFKDLLPELMKNYSAEFGCYPFRNEKYSNVLNDVSGGMENQTCTFIGTSAFYNGVIAHELAHQWFGDNVTCKTWNDIYLNEGFATYAEYLAFENIGMMTSHQQYVFSENGGSVYVYDTTNIARVFDSRLTYSKGACVIHTLRFILGDEYFFQTLKSYQAQFGGSTASTNDLKQIAEKVSRIDLDSFFRQWVYGEGYPLYKMFYNNDDSHLVIRLQQTTSMSKSVAFFSNPVEIACKYSNGDTVFFKVQPDSNDQLFYFNTTGKLTPASVDPKSWIINKELLRRKDTTLNLIPPYIPPPPPEPIDSISDTIRIYPNPMKSILIIDGINDTHTSVTVYDMLGNRVFSKSLNIGKNELAIKQLKSGEYFVSLVRNGKEIRTEKIMKTD